MSSLRGQDKERVPSQIAQMFRNLFYSNVEIPSSLQGNSATNSKYKRIWSKEQTAELYQVCKQYSETTGKPLDQLKPIDFQYISVRFPQTTSQCLAKFSEIMKTGTMKPGSWSSEEDDLLRVLVNQGNLKWGKIAKTINYHIYNGVKVRNGKKSKERWLNHLDPSVNKDKWTIQEDLTLLEAFQTYGQKWKKISDLLENRTDSYVKNRFKSLINKEKQKPEPDSDQNIIKSLIYNYRQKLGLEVVEEI